MADSRYTAGLLTPPKEKDEIVPYLPVWRPLIAQSIIVIIITILCFIAFGLFSLALPEVIQTNLNRLLIALPTLAWLAMSLWPERSVIQPRQQLLTVAILGAITANAIGIPLINDFFQIDRWLPLSDAISRIIGYTFTVGITEVAIKYLVIRYTVWSNAFRIRLDGLAYGVACGIGYATVLNVSYLANNPTASTDVVATRVLAIYVLQVVTSAILGYGLAEVKFSTTPPVLMLLTVALAATIAGIAIPIRAGLTNPVLGLEGSFPRPLLGLGFSVVLFVAILVILSFLFSSSERRALESASAREEQP